MNLHSLSRKFRHFQTHSFRRIEKLCRKSEYISFDVFDTLLYRRVDSARDIFQIMEQQLNIPGFCEKRIAANQAIRKEALTDSHGEIREDFTLEEIYDYYESITPEECQRFARLECSLEVEYCHPRHDVMAIYNACLRMGKPVLLISDMYLPRDCMEQMLAKCGYQNYTALYISGEEGKLKLTGNLFRSILKSRNISAHSLLHIGDNPVSDFIRPKQLSIKAVKIKALSKADKLRTPIT